MATQKNSTSSVKPTKHKSSSDSSTYNKYSGWESIKPLNSKPDKSQLTSIKEYKPKDKYEPRYVTASKPQGKSKTEWVSIKTVPSTTTKSGSVATGGGKATKRKTTNKKY